MNSLAHSLSLSLGRLPVRPFIERKHAIRDGAGRDDKLQMDRPGFGPRLSKRDKQVLDYLPTYTTSSSTYN